MRTKMIAGNLLAVLVVGLVSYFVVSSQLQATLLGEVDASISEDHAMFDQTWRLWGLELAEQAVAQAAEDDTRDIFTALDEADTRSRAYSRATEIHDWFGRHNRSTRGSAELVVIVNDDGRVIARSQDRNRMHGEDLTEQLSGLEGVLANGGSTLDVWEFSSGQEKILQAAIAAIVDPENGRPMGAIVVGYDLSNGMASRAAQLLGRDIAFVHGDVVYSSSLEGDAVDQLRGVLFGEQSATTTAALGDGGATSEPWLAQVGDVQYVGVTGAISYSPSAHVGYVVLGNRTAQADKASVANTILIMTAIGCAIVIVFCFLLAGSFLKPVEEMEEGVLAVINGRTDLRLDIESAELGGLAYRINQLLNVFTGTPEADDDGRISSPPGAWPQGPSGLTEVPAAARVPQEAPRADSGVVDDDQLAAELSAEPEDAYYDRLFSEYVAAKEAAGENVSNVTKDKFVMRLQANEKSLIKKHDCRMVRFQVQVAGTQVNLRPVIIR
ncbi:MAG: hypothetical protein H6719_01115 [Sandaracinaceae bacterium]|nr:hypothetical protein [Sandaracinaceae bacterium]